MIINNNFDTIIETEQIKNPLIPFFVEKIGEGDEQAIKVGILPGTVLFLATKQVFCPVKDVLYFNCVKDDCIYLNLTVGIKKSPVVVKINWKDPNVYINCFLEPRKDRLIKETVEREKYVEEQIIIVEQRIEELKDMLKEAINSINEDEFIPDELKPRAVERAEIYYNERIEFLKCGPLDTASTTTTTTTTSTTSTTTTTLAPKATACVEQYETIYKPVEYPGPPFSARSICVWRKEIERLGILRKRIMETYNQDVSIEKEDSIRYAKHNQFSINKVSISMSREQKAKEEELSKQSDTEVVEKFLLGKVEEIDEILTFIPTKFEFPQLIIKYGLGNEETKTFKNPKIVNCVYPDVNKYTKIEFFLTSV